MVTVFPITDIPLSTTDPLPSPVNLSSTFIDKPHLDSSLVCALSIPLLDGPMTPTDLKDYWATLGLSLDSTDHYSSLDPTNYYAGLGSTDHYADPSPDDLMALTELKTYLFSPNFAQMEHELNGRGMWEFSEWIRHGSNPIENKKSAQAPQ